MPRYDKAYRPRAKTVAPSSPSRLCSRKTALRRPCEPSQESSGERLESLAVSGLTKTEAEELLDYLEAAGYGLCQLSYVNGEGFSIRLSCGSKKTARCQCFGRNLG